MKILFLLGVSFLSLKTFAQTVNLENGKKKSQSCSVCHGENGISSNELWPNLAHQKEKYLIQQLENFRSGLRKSEIMNPISQVLTDQDILDISAYYSKGIK